MLRVCVAASIISVVINNVSGYAQWGLQYNGVCSKSTSNPNITNCNAQAYTENMIAIIDSQNGIDFNVQYNEIGEYSYWYNELNFTVPNHPEIHGTWEFRDDSGVVYGRMYATGVRSEYHEDANKYWVNSVMYNIENSTGVFSNYSQQGFIVESSLGNGNGNFESIISVSVYGPDRSSSQKNLKFKQEFAKRSLHYQQLNKNRKQQESSN